MYRLNKQAAELAVRAAKEVTAETGKQRYAAGAMGPTNRTLSISPKVEQPEFRNISEYIFVMKIYLRCLKTMSPYALRLELNLIKISKIVHVESCKAHKICSQL